MESESDYVPDKFAFYRSGAAVCIGTVETLYVRSRQAACILAALAVSGNDCDRPIRCWLAVMMSLYFAHVGFLILAECIPACGSYTLRKLVGESYLAMNSVIQGCILIWVLLGNVWFYDCAKQCKNGDFHADYEEGFTMMVVILATYYSLLLIVGIAVIVLTILVCVGSSAANRAKYATLN